MPALNVVSNAVTWLASLTTPSPAAPMRCRRAPQATLGHGRQPDSRLFKWKKQERELESGNNGQFSSGKSSPLPPAPSCFLIPSYLLFFGFQIPLVTIILFDLFPAHRPPSLLRLWFHNSSAYPFH